MFEILLIEDNERIQQNNQVFFERAGYRVHVAMTIREAWASLDKHRPDAIILDINLPDGNGLDFLEKLRKTSQIPVLLLTALDSPDDTTRGLDAGSDDYLAKPYNIKVLRARVEALIRRSSRVPEVIHKGTLRLDVTANVATLNHKHLNLTQKEFALLLFFAQNEETFYCGQHLYEKIWKTPMIDDNQAIRKTVSNLRSKIKDSGWAIVWSRGEGWSFERE